MNMTREYVDWCGPFIMLSLHWRLQLWNQSTRQPHIKNTYLQNVKHWLAQLFSNFVRTFVGKNRFFLLFCTSHAFLATQTAYLFQERCSQNCQRMTIQIRLLIWERLLLFVPKSWIITSRVRLVIKRVSFSAASLIHSNSAIFVIICLVRGITKNATSLTRPQK